MELTEVSLRNHDFESLQRGIATAVRRVIGEAEVGVALYIADGDYLQLLPRSFGGSAQLTGSSQVDVAHPDALSARVMRLRRGEFTNDAPSSTPSLVEWYEAFGIRQLLTVPLVGGDRPVGLLHVANPSTAFTDTDLALLEEMAPFVAGTLEHSIRRIYLNRNERLTNAMGEIAGAIAGGRSLTDLITRELREFCSAINADVLAISFVGEQEPRVFLRYGDVSDDAVARLLDESKRPRVSIELHRVRSRGIGHIGVSRAHLPVVVSGVHQASLSLLRRPGSPFSADEMKAIGRLGGVVALAWATESYHREVDLRARADERHRIADELHDHVAQLLFGAELTIDAVLKDLSVPGSDAARTRQSASRARDLLVRGEVALRDRMNSLSSPSGAGLRERIDSLIHDIEEEFGVSIRVSAQLDSGVDAGLPPAIAGIVLRAIREGMINAAKHAQPCRIELAGHVTPDDILVMTVRDDGVEDFEPGRAGHGLPAVRRMLGAVGGTLRVERVSGSLTEYEVCVALVRH